MKKVILVAGVLSGIAGVAQAQTNVTLYGVIDTTIRYTTNQQVNPGCTANCVVGSQTALAQGAFQGSRIGFKGEEDLGGGLAAVFKLENGFNGTNGALGQGGLLFGRQEFVGLKDKSWGELDAGRQYGVAFDLLGNYDPLGIGNYDENEWAAFIYGFRFNNSLKYTKNWGPVTAEVQYAIGGQAGATSIGATTGLSLAYTQGPFSIGGVYQQSKDANSNLLKVAGLGSSYVAGPATLYLQYFDAKRDPGFATAASNSGGPLANTSLLSNAGNTLQRKDGMWTAGVLFKATPAWTYTVAYMHDEVKNESSLGDSGKISTIYAIADYNLSKRTDIYFDIDHTTLRGGEVDDANTIMGVAGAPLGGNTSRNGVAAGLRVKF